MALTTSSRFLSVLFSGSLRTLLPPKSPLPKSMSLLEAMSAVSVACMSRVRLIYPWGESLRSGYPIEAVDLFKVYFTFMSVLWLIV